MTVKLETSPRLKGVSAIRAAMALGLAKSPGGAELIAEDRWGATSAPLHHIKAAVPSLSASELTEGGASVPAEFFAAAVERSAVGTMTGVRRVPFYIRAVSAAMGARAYWLTEGAATPVSKASLEFDALEPSRIGAITVATEEAFRFSGDAIEAGLRGDLLRALSATINHAMFDPDSSDPAAPASLLAAPGAGAVDDWDDARLTLLDAFAGDLEAAYLAMSPRTAALATASDRPDIGARGGSLWGIPAVTGTGIPPGIVALVDPTQVALAQAGGEIRTTHEATVELADDPSDNSLAPVGTDVVSLWQTNSAALGISAFADWRVMKPGAVTWVAFE